MKFNKSKEILQKNGAVEKKNSIDEKAPAVDCEDPFISIQAMLDKKCRNLEKKKTKALQLKSLMDDGRELNQDQKATALAAKEVESNIEIVKEVSASVAALRSEFLQAKVERSSAISQKISQDNVNANSIKLDVYKYIMETQNSLKKVVDHAEAIKNNKPSDHTLKSDEVDKLVSFWKLIKPSESADSSVRIKKVIQTLIFLSNKDNRIVTEELGVSFAQINTMIKKINSSLKSIQTQAATAPQKEDNHVLKVEEKKAEPVLAVPRVAVVEKVIEKLKESKEPTEASDGWIEIIPPVISSKRRDSYKPQVERNANHDLTKKSNIRNAGVQNGVEEVKGSVKVTKPQIVITDLPASNSNKMMFKEHRNYKEFPNSNKGFKRYREQQPQVETTAANST